MATDYELKRLEDKIKQTHGKDTKIIGSTVVLWDGWESDTRAVIFELDSQWVLGTTNHGSLTVVTDDEAIRKFFDDKLAEYRAAIESTTKLRVLF